MVADPDVLHGYLRSISHNMPDRLHWKNVTVLRQRKLSRSLMRQIGMFFGGNADLDSLLKEGAQVVDVQSCEEFASGHLKGSINIPLSELNRNLNKIRKDKTVIVCCASGMPSASAKKSVGITWIYRF